MQRLQEDRWRRDGRQEMEETRAGLYMPFEVGARTAGWPLTALATPTSARPRVSIGWCRGWGSASHCGGGGGRTGPSFALAPTARGQGGRARAVPPCCCSSSCTECSECGTCASPCLRKVRLRWKSPQFVSGYENLT